METQPVLTTFELRVIIAVIGAFVLMLIFLMGRPKKAKQAQQSRRTALRLDDEVSSNGRIEPHLGDPDAAPAQGEFSIAVDDDISIERFGSAHGDDQNLPSMHAGDDLPSRPAPSSSSITSATAPASTAAVHADATSARGPQRSTLGARPPGPIDRIVTLYVSARAGENFNGSDLVVAAEKAGLQFGDMSIFHRMAPGKLEKGPVFSMATMTKPGNFDMKHLGQLSTPGVTLFMTLPGPLSALDAWDTLLPTAQRIAELLDGVVLDEQRHVLGRQHIAHLRDELRAWDRQQDRQQIKPTW